MNDLYGFLLLVVGSLGTISWWLGRGWINHVDKIHADLYEKNRQIHERVNAENRECQRMHMELERKLGRIEGKLNGGL
jgi:hypothetical protein